MDVVIHLTDEEADDDVAERVMTEVDIIHAALSAIVKDRICITQDRDLITAALLTSFQIVLEGVGETEQ